MKISDFLLFVLTSCWMMALVQSQSCPANVFGPKCKFLCHCDGDNCQDPYAICTQGSSCTPGYFGPGCSYRNNLEAVGDASSIPPEIEDYDDNTCMAPGTQFVTLTFNESIWFTWMKVVTQPVAASIVQAIDVTFDSGLPCDNKHVYSSSNTAYITCDLPTTYTSMKVAGAVAEKLCSIYVSRGRNIAIGQATNQTDTLMPEYTSDKAVDGNEDPILENGSCSHTATTGNTAWSVFFDYPSAIQKVYIKNRSIYRHKLMDSSITTYNVLNNLVEKIVGPNLTVATFEIDFNKGKDIKTYVKWLSILQPVTQLAICEVVVYGDFVCPDGTWDLDCSKTCTCAVGESCFPVTGQCSSGCPAGNYGFNCLSPCPTNCLNNMCKNRHGDCFSCKRGYSGAICETECAAGKYGFDCNETCSSHCHQFCDKISGVCVGDCKNGFYGNFCQFPCPPNCENDTCHVVTGSCAACKPGFYDKNCNKTCNTACLSATCDFTSGSCDGCANGFYGQFCQLPCPSNCLNITCDASTGSCAACKPGSYDTHCNKTCSSGCLSKTCNFTSGSCDVCKDGFYGAKCETPCPNKEKCKANKCDAVSGSCTSCSDNYHGQKCDLQCPNDCGSQLCQRNNGSCFSCRDGYYSPKCDSTCPSQCMENRCGFKTGECTQGVVSDEQNHYWMYLLLFIPLIALAMCFLWGRSRKKPKPEHE